MSDLLPCPFCGSAAKICEDEEGYFCVACMGECFSCTEPHGEPAHAADTWNQRSPDPALLALARLGAMVVRDYFRVEGFVRVSGHLLDSDAAYANVTTAGVPYPTLSPGIAAAIARLLAPDGAGEVAP